MKNRLQGNDWIYSVGIVLGCIVAAIVVGIIALRLLGEPVIDTLSVLGLVAATGLVRLLFPLPHELKLQA